MSGKEIAITASAIALSISMISGGLFWVLCNYTIVTGEAGIFVIKTPPTESKEPCFVGLNIDGRPPECYEQ